MQERLNLRTLPQLPANVQRPDYDPQATRIGIVHFGPGAFHRAHQAVYVDDLLRDDPTWAICAVALNSSDVRDALQPQDGLYALALLDAQPQLRVIGAIREVLAAREQQAQVLARLADENVRLVTLTITEKGYCLDGDGLDSNRPEIVHDLANPDAPNSAIGYLVAGLRARKRLGLMPYTVLSCDNLADNGGKLRRATLKFALRIDADLAEWIEREVAFPRSMVDSITPATDDALRARVASELGMRDAWPIQRERYTQWVIEDNFCNARPAFECVGVTMSDDIAGHDRAKLRLLNGPHSTLAYVGSLLDIETVFDAMNHAPLARFVEILMREHIAPSLAALHGFDANAYIDAILERFRNPAIRHKLAQIAWDGSQKLPVRLFGTITEALAAGRSIERLCVPVAAWLQFVRRQANDGVALVDPLDAALTEIGRACNGDAQHDVASFLALDAVFANVRGDAHFVDALQKAYAALGDGSPQAVQNVLR